MSRGFLKKSDLKIIQNKFKHLLVSSEASPITITYLASHTGTWDVDRGEYDGGVATWSSTTSKAILKIITIYDKQLIDLGSISVGDCIFMISKDLDISSLLDTNLKRWYITYRSVKWYPKNMNVNPADNVSVPLGNEQVCQSIICSRTEKSEAEKGDEDW